MEGRGVPIRISTALRTTTLLVSLGAVTPLLASEPASWRTVQPRDPGDLVARVARGFDHLTRDVVDEVEVETSGVALETDGADFRVRLPRVALAFEGLRGWDGEITGRLEARDVLLAYGPLGVGDTAFLGETSFDATLHVDVPSLLDHMEDRHFEEARLRFPEADRRTVLEGKLDVGFLFVSWDPKVRVEGYFALDGERFVFHPTETEVRDAPGFVRSKVRDRLARKSRRGFGLEEGLGTLRDRGLPLGTVHLSHVRDGEVLNRQELRPLPQPLRAKGN